MTIIGTPHKYVIVGYKDFDSYWVLPEQKWNIRKTSYPLYSQAVAVSKAKYMPNFFYILTNPTLTEVDTAVKQLMLKKVLMEE